MHKIVTKRHKPFSSYGTQKQKLDQEFRKRGMNMKKQIRVMGLVPIMLGYHRKQIFEISIHSL
jgi:hypothetical protein